MLAIEGNLVHPDLLVNRLHLPLAISNEFLLASKFLSRFGISLLLRWAFNFLGKNFHCIRGLDVLQLLLGIIFGARLLYFKYSLSIVGRLSRYYVLVLGSISVFLLVLKPIAFLLLLHLQTQEFLILRLNPSFLRSARIIQLLHSDKIVKHACMYLTVLAFDQLQFLLQTFNGLV